MPTLRLPEEVVPERFIRTDGGVMCDSRLMPQERIHRLCTGKVELSVGDWQALIAKVFSVDPVRAWEAIEEARATEKTAHQLLFHLRNRLPVSKIERKVIIEIEHDDGTIETKDGIEFDELFDRKVMQKIDALILSHFQPEPFRCAGPVVTVAEPIIDFSI